MKHIVADLEYVLPNEGWCVAKISLKKKNYEIQKHVNNYEYIAVG